MSFDRGESYIGRILGREMDRILADIHIKGKDADMELYVFGMDMILYPIYVQDKKVCSSYRERARKIIEERMPSGPRGERLGKPRQDEFLRKRRWNQLRELWRLAYDTHLVRDRPIQDWSFDAAADPAETPDDE